MSTPKVLVTICCYNHGKYLDEAVQSIIDQTYTNLDICIIDDGSDPGQDISRITRVLQQRDDRIRVITLPKNIGKWHGLNEAIRTTDAVLCTSHDADDISLPNRIERQVACLMKTQTLHNLCGFHHCWTEDDVSKAKKDYAPFAELLIVDPETVLRAVMTGRSTPGINHYFTGQFETAGVSALFYRQIWEMGIRFNPPGVGIRTLASEDSDFNFRVTALLSRTSILAEQPYCYRRNTSTNNERT
jgi:glycosyltransferase involved in cell wall biosynthesis